MIRRLFNHLIYLIDSTVLGKAGTKLLRESKGTVISLGMTGVSFILGFIGYCRLAPPHNIFDVLETCYKTMELVTVHMPQKLPDLPLELQISRFTLPLTTLWLGIGSYLAYLRRPIKLYSLQAWQDHLIVCGIGPRALSMAKQAAAAGQRVALLSDDPHHQTIHHLESGGATILLGRLTSPEIFVHAGLHKAGAVVVATGSDIVNIRAAIAIRNLTLAERPSHRPPLTLVTECESRDMASILDGAFREIREPTLECRLLAPFETVARGLLPKLRPALGTPAEPGAVLLVGDGPLIDALFETILRNGPDGLAIGLAAGQAEARLQQWRRGAPGLPAIDQVILFSRKSDRDLWADDALAQWIAKASPSAVIIDSGADEGNLAIGIALRRFVRDHALPSPAVFLRQEGENSGFEALKLMDGEALDLSRIVAFGGLDEECAPAVILNGDRDRLARLVHDDYLAGGASGESALPWSALKETYRQASRNQADHLEAKLAAAGCRLIADAGRASPFAFTPAEVETLADMEHRRWCVDRWLDGWIFGPVKDSVRRTHPALLPYDQLSEEVKEYDRRAVRNLPALAARSDQAIAREWRIGLSTGPMAGRTRIMAAEVRTRQDFAILVIPVGLDSGVEPLAMALAEGMAFELVLSAAVPVLLQRLDRQILRRALDRADRVTVAFAAAEEQDPRDIVRSRSNVMVDEMT